MTNPSGKAWREYRQREEGFARQREERGVSDRCGEHGVQRRTCAGWKHHTPDLESRFRDIEAERDRMREALADVRRIIRNSRAARNVLDTLAFVVERALTEKSET